MIRAGRLFLFMAVMLFSRHACAYTLEELMAHAVNNRDTIREYVADLEKSREDVRFFRGNFYPRLDLNYTVNQLDDDTSSENEKNSIFAGAMTLNVFSGFKDTYDYQSGQYRYTATEFQLDAIKQDIQLAVALRLLAVYQSKAWLRVVEDTHTLYRERYTEAKLKHKVGLLKKADVLKIKVVMDDAAQNVRDAQARLAKDLNDLTRTVGMEDRRITLGQLGFTAFRKLPESVKTYEDYAPVLLEKRSELNALRSQQEAARLQIRSARASVYPRADLSLGYQRYGENYLPDGGDDSEDEVRLQMTVSMNIFDGFQKYTDIRKARLDSKSVRYQLNELEQTFKNELRNILEDLDVAFNNYQVAQESLTEAEENQRINELSFRKGVATATDILDAISYLSQARFNIITAGYGIFSNHYRLTRMIEGFDKNI
ncbi:TolC family protein [Desulfonema ishimotonii]|uniref:TolC family protein n=1 Tax=Desulfonema ishimotonii TaxID=45657 RepID=A0A401FUC8_9BACT|nr:TolC family protein [Desulfonema ishimotonii]